MSAIINGDSPSITFSDATTQATSAVVSGKVPYSILPTGSVLQVVNATYSTQVTNATNSYVDTGLTATITPKFATSKILVIVTQQGVNKNEGNAANQVNIKLLRGATDLGNTVYVWGYMNSAIKLTGNATFQYMDSPATTSSTTYKTQFNNGANASLATVQLDSAVASTIILMEIAG